VGLYYTKDLKIWAAAGPGGWPSGGAM